jgi:copper amine oxidase-like protein
MKRFLSLFAIVAMIVSMFSGVGFAAQSDVDKIVAYATAKVATAMTVAELNAATELTTAVGDNIDEYKAAVAGYNDAHTEDALDTKAEIIAVVAKVNLDKIVAYATAEVATAMTVAELNAATELTTAVGTNLDAYKAAVAGYKAAHTEDGVVKDELDTKEEIINLVNDTNESEAITRISGAAKDKDKAKALVILDFQHVVGDKAVAEKLHRYQSSVLLSVDDEDVADPTLLDSKEKIETMVNNMNQDLEIVLDNHDNVTYNKGWGPHDVSGKIVNADGAVVEVNPLIAIFQDGKDSKSVNGLLSQAEYDEGAKETPDHVNFVDRENADDGVFSIRINANVHGQFLVFGITTKDAFFENCDGSVYVDIDKQGNTDPANTEKKVVVKHDKYRVLPKAELREYDELKFAYPVKNGLTISGAFTNEDAPVVIEGETTDERNAHLQIGYVDDYGCLMTTDPLAEDAGFVSKDSFGFIVEDVLNKTGEIGIFLDGVLLIKGEITVGELPVSLSTKRIPRALGPQELTLDYDLGKTYVVEGNENTESDYRLQIRVKQPDDTYLDLSATKVRKPGDVVDYETVNSGTDNTTAIIVEDSGDLKFTDAKKQKVTVQLDVKKEWETGTYELVCQLYNKDAQVIQERTFNFTVKNPSSYTLINWDDSEFKVGTVRIELPKNPSAAADVDPVYEEKENTIQQLRVKKYSAGNITEIKYFEVDVKGCGIDETLTNLTDSDQDFSTALSISQTGELNITIRAYDDKDEAPVATFTKDIIMTGWNIEITPNVVTVDTDEDITFIITDEEGKPVNNAVIWANGEIIVNGNTHNIIAGTYVYEEDEKDLFEKVSDIKLEFKKSVLPEAEAEVELKSGIEVVGEEVFALSSETSTLLNGQKETFYVSVLDENGDIVYPTFTRIDVTASGKQSKADASEITMSSTRKDLDGDGQKEAIKITVTPNKNQVAMILRATTEAGKKKGEIKLEVKAPQLVMTGANTLTENFKNKLEFQIVDPRDNSVIENNVYFVANKKQINFTVATADKSEVQVTEGKSEPVGSEDEKFNYVIFVDDVNWKQVEKDEDDAVIKVMMDLGHVDDKDVKLMEIPIANAKLTSDPERVIMGTTTNLTLTYVDAEDKPLEGYVVKLGDEEIGETDENGQLPYSASITSSVALTFTAKTDDSKKTDPNPVEGTGEVEEEDGTLTSLKVRAGADMIAPTVSYEIVGSNTAIITFKDNVRVIRAKVNGEEVDIFYNNPTHEVKGLKPGINKINVAAVDAVGNALVEVLEIVIEQTSEPVTLKLNEATDFGTPVKVGSTSMIPARLVEELGVSFAWDAEAQTVEYTYGETTVQLTVGSKTGIVNGENVPVAEAPYLNDKGRLMVPVRMVGQSLGFDVKWSSDDAPIIISKIVK